MKIALISPEWRFENTYPPLGLAYIASVLENAGHIVKIFDQTLDRNKSHEEKTNEIVDFSPEIVGISAMSHNYSIALKVAIYVKTMTGASIVFGGPHPTIMPEDVLRNEFIDFVIMGEGEEVFLKLCQNYVTKDFRGVDGLCYKENDKIIIQPKNHFIENLDTMPLPARHLLDLDKYRLVDDFGNKMVTIISSRGCPYRCTYCFKGLFGTVYRQRSSNNIIEEIKHCIDRYGYKSFYFIDDLFTLNSERVKELTNEIINLGVDIRWQCLARVNNATLGMFQQMKNAGCYKVHFGIESGNQDVLNKIRKGITLDQIRNAVKYCEKAKIRTKGYFMLGMPGDTKERMQDTIDFAKELKLNDLMFSITTPFPGTELWKLIDKNNIMSFSDAFYYSCDSDEVKIFHNMSDATDEDIIEMSRIAKKITDSTSMKIYCERNFGNTIGPFAWQLSKIPIFKRIGKDIIDLVNEQKKSKIEI